MQSLPKNIAWGTDSVKEKLGDYFKVKTLSRPWQPVPLAATPTGSAQRESHYDLVDPAVVSNPFALYAQMRAHDPIWWSPQLGVWFVTRHEDCRRILVDPRFKATRMTTLLDLKFPDHRLHPSSVYFRFTNAAMMWTDGDRHRTHRAAVHPPFGAPQLERHRQTLRRVIDELLDDLIPRGRADAAPDICDEFPRRMVVATCALPAADKAILEDWTSDIAHFFLGPRPQRTIDDVNSGLYQLLDYCREKYRERGARPGDDLISEIVRASRSCDPELVVHQLALILLAGFSPTSPGLLGPGLLAFVEHPEQRRKFMAHPELRAGGVNEALRFNGSNQYTYRLCSERVELAPGMTIEAGDVVAPCLGSANRDPEVFENPDRFDIERVNSQRHLSFGYGPHFCLGAALGRMEGQVVFERLFSRIPDLQLDGSPQWNEYLEFRTLWSLPLKWSTP